MRPLEDIAAIIDRYNLADRDALLKLEAHIRRDLPIREVLFFADYLHGGDFTSSSGKWRKGSSGYVTQTHQEDSALTRLWSALVRSAHFYIGAASVLKMQDARLLAGCAFADEGDGPTLYDFTLDQLVRAVPKEYRKQLDAASKLDAILAANARLEAQGAELKKDVGDIGGTVKKESEDISFLRETNRENLQRSNDFLAIMPDKEELGEIRKAVRTRLDETKKTSRISNETAARIFKAFYPDPNHVYSTLTGHTVGNWIKRGELPKHPNFKIDEKALASKLTFLQWLVTNCDAIGIKINISTETSKMLESL